MGVRASASMFAMLAVTLAVVIGTALLLTTLRQSLIAEIDHARPPEVGLATACRLFVLAELTREG